MEQVNNIFKGVVVVAVIITLIQLALNSVLGFFGMPGITITQTVSFVFLIYMGVLTVSIAWHKGK